MTAGDLHNKLFLPHPFHFQLREYFFHQSAVSKLVGFLYPLYENPSQDLFPPEGSFKVAARYKPGSGEYRTLSFNKSSE